MNKKITVLFAILIFILSSHFTFAHGKKHHKKQTTITNTAITTIFSTSSAITTKESIGINISTQSSIVVYSDKEKRLIAEIEKRKEFRKSLIPITIVVNIFVSIFAIFSIINIRRKNKI